METSTAPATDTADDVGVTLPLTYALPIKVQEAEDELAGYLHRLVGEVAEVIVVDGSSAEVFDAHRRSFPAGVRHVRPDPALVVEMPSGKVAGVHTALALAGHDVVVLADDDVRWERDQLELALARLGDAGVLRPQNVFTPTAWHTWWDTGRALVHRAVGGDWPGTLVVRRAALPEGYSGDALFENLELVRTVRAGGWSEVLALDIVVARRPPTTEAFLRQRVRQAYDEWARPGYLLAELSILPAVLLGRRRAAALVAAAAVATAEVGRRRGGGRRCWGPTAPLAAPLWLAERAVTSWIAVGSRARGGARYRGRRFPLAAHSVRALRADAEARVR